MGKVSPATLFCSAALLKEAWVGSCGDCPYKSKGRTVKYQHHYCRYCELDALTSSDSESTSSNPAVIS